MDVLLVTGDPDLDHPSFPANLLKRWLEAHGYVVGLVARPDVSSPAGVAAQGRPRLFAGVTAGALDSLVANTTALKKRRSDDPYGPDGRAGGRPDRAVTVYANLLRRAFGKETLVIAGGLEAGLRRFAHYDYWSDSVRRPLLLDCGADALVHGMGEAPILEIAGRLAPFADRSSPAPRDERLAALRGTPGLVVKEPRSAVAPEGALALPSAEEVAADPVAHARAFRLQEQRRDRVLTQEAGGMRVVAWPAAEATPELIDRVYGLPFTRNPSPAYGGARFPALEQVRFSVTSHRGCFGGCAFCAIGAQQGKAVVSRSEASVLAEVRQIVSHGEFRGTIPDLGGPTANMYGQGCRRPQGPCDRPSCLWPSRCQHLATDHERYRKLLAAAARVPGVKHLFVTTGVRMDLALLSEPFVCDLAKHYTSGQLKVAPEHVAPPVLAAMRKPEGNDLEAFVQAFARESTRAGKKQFVLPYFIAAHPGSRLADMLEVALLLHRTGLRVEQCQIFTPTPGTAATVMYATGLDPRTLEPVYVERDPHRKQLQKALILYREPENATLVREALRELGREELAPILGVRARP
jgi:uncharacterized radical SAM protein YgiQ